MRDVYMLGGVVALVALLAVAFATSGEAARDWAEAEPFERSPSEQRYIDARCVDVYPHHVLACEKTATLLYWTERGEMTQRVIDRPRRLDWEQ
jgi:hypothetical protein